MSERITAERLGQLLAQHGPALALAAAQWTDAADDCVQEALIELAALPLAPERPAAWLFKRVRQRALNAARASRRRRDHESTAWRDRLRPCAGRIDAGEALDLIEALAELTPEDRELITLRFFSDLPYAEIAEAVGGSTSNAHRRTEKALAQLRRRLEALCPKRIRTTI